MGFMDKLKGAVNAVTGGAAKVTIEFPQQVRPGQPIPVKVTAVSTGAEVKSKGCYVDLLATETVRVPKSQVQGAQFDVTVSNTTFNKEILISQPFVLAPNTTKVFEGTVEVPVGTPPNINLHYTKHSWQIRGRIEAFGNDPDSGFLAMNVG